MSSSIIVRKEEDIGDIDPTRISRSVFVTGFNAATKSEDLIIHFQRKKNGGGDIDSIVISSKKVAAVVTFDDPEVVSSLLQHKQEFKGVILTVVPYLDTLLSKHEHYFQVFELVSAELCLEFVEYLSRDKTKTLLNDVEVKTGIKWLESSESFVMSGTLKQVEEAHSFLQENACQSTGIVVSNCLKRSNWPSDERCKDIEAPLDDEYDIQEDVSQDSPPKSAENEDTRSPNKTKDSTSDGHKVNSESPDIECFEIEPKFLGVFWKAQKMELENIETKYHVEIPKKADGKKLGLKPKESCTTEDYEQACDLFVTLYQNTYQQVQVQRFSLKTETSIITVRKKISEMSKSFPVSVEIVNKGKKHWVLYGEASHVEEALSFLEKEGVEINRERESEKGRGHKAKDVEEDMEVDPPETSNGEKNPGHRLETYIGGRIKLSIYKDDLTKQRVDVIVNAANRELQHDGGVAAAILAKGGRTINEESQAIIKTRGFLKDGEAVVTNSGKLPCKAVVHAVGPRWNDVGAKKSKKILRRACLNIFAETEKRNLTSVALPAIGTGIHGMPKDVCAEVMFDALDEFVRQGDAKKKKITDIRFVDINDPSVQAFSIQFKKRYGDDPESYSREKETGGGTSGHSSSTAGAVGGRSTVSTSRFNRGRGQSRADNRHTALNPNDVSTGRNDQRSFSTSAVISHDPLSNHSDHLSNSYSKVVKGNIRGHEMMLPQDQQRQGHEEKKSGHGVNDEKQGKEDCPICLDHISSPRSLKCKHRFCSDCIQTALNVCNKCPVCQQPQGIIKGNQPHGEMTFYTDLYAGVPGYKGYGTIVINYQFPSGVQGPEHPNPGQRYQGTSRTAYLPDNREGREVLQLLRRAFDARLVFTIGTSNTTGLSNQVTWNDIHHKTNISGGPYGFGYPDPDYFRRVKEELAAKGIR